MRERHREAQDTDVFQKENKFISIQQLLFLFTILRFIEIERREVTVKRRVMEVIFADEQLYSLPEVFIFSFNESAMAVG